MSERLSSVEIEDVLSSIRRLVSEDLRSGARPAEAAPPAEAAKVAQIAEGPGRLLLTPSLRIAPEPVAEEEEEGLDEPAPFHSRRGEGEDVARVGAVLDEAARTLEPATEEDVAPAASAVPDWFVEEEVAAALPQESIPETAEPAAVLADAAAEAAEEAARLDAVEGFAGDGQDAIAAVDDTDLLTEAEEAGPVLSGADAVEPAVEPFGAAAPVEAEAAASGAEAPFWAEAELEAEPEAVTAAAPAGDARWADAAEAEIRRELEEEAEATVFARFDAGPQEAGEALYDEEMLRDLVRDIIREELQGALGERITRNVRKLVRAEIARALAVRDFE